MNLSQEEIIRQLEYIGIEKKECYGLLKSMAKKRFEEYNKYKKTFIDGYQKRMIEDRGEGAIYAEKLAMNAWEIIVHSALYARSEAHLSVYNYCKNNCENK